MEGALDMSADTAAMPSLTDMSEKELMKLEREIAHKYMGGVPWFAVAWGLINPIVWLALWPLVLTGIMPLWLAFPVATFNVMISYLPSHEAQHDIIARPGSKLRWLNELVGHVSVIPLASSYGALRTTHMEHHKHTNNPDLDPDHSTSARNGFAAIWQSLLNRQPGATGGFKKYGEVLQKLDTPEARRAIRDSIFWELFYYGTLFTMAWTGHAIEVALIWWLPRHIGLTYIQYYLSWAPHHPAKQTGRYKDTRAFRSKIGNLGSMGMQFHIIHHLHPRIPLTRTPAAYWDMRPMLEARGCDLEKL